MLLSLSSTAAVLWIAGYTMWTIHKDNEQKRKDFSMTLPTSPTPPLPEKPVMVALVANQLSGIHLGHLISAENAETGISFTGVLVSVRHDEELSKRDREDVVKYRSDRGLDIATPDDNGLSIRLRSRIKAVRSGEKPFRVDPTSVIAVSTLPATDPTEKDNK